MALQDDTIDDLHAEDLGRMLDESRAEGFGFLTRLVEEWASGENRFDRPGEALLLLVEGGEPVAVGGLNVDPYHADPGVGRLRNVYVLRAARRSGVGSRLVRRLLERAAAAPFTRVRLRTNTAEGAAFYERLGFRPTDEAWATHVYRLGVDARGHA